MKASDIVLGTLIAYATTRFIGLYAARAPPVGGGDVSPGYLGDDVSDLPDVTVPVTQPAGGGDTPADTTNPADYVYGFYYPADLPRLNRRSDSGGPDLPPELI